MSTNAVSDGWLPHLPPGWQRLRAKHLFCDVADRNHPDERLLSATQVSGVVPRDESDIRVWNPGDDVSQYKLVVPGDFVISLRSFQGGLERSEVRGILSPAYTVARPNHMVHGGYFKHVLKSDGMISALNVTTTGIRQGKNISFSDFAELELPVPPLPAQTLIADYLDIETARIDSLIDHKQRFIDLLLEKRTALITHAVTKGLDPNVEMKDSGWFWIGRTPHKWVVQPFKYLLSRNDSGAWGGEPVGAQTDTPVLRSTEQTLEGEWRIHSPAMRSLTARERECTLLESGDLVVTKSSGSEKHIGKTTIAEDEHHHQYCYSNFMQRLRVRKRVMVPRYAWYLFNSPIVRDQLSYLATTTTGLANLNGSVLGLPVVPVPPIVEQQAIVRVLDAELSRLGVVIKSSRRSIELLREYRIALISAAVTGQIDIPGTETSEEVA